MSDLISRSELLKRFLVNKDGHRIPERDCDNFEVTVSIKDVKTIIKEQPTAYSVDKVVEKLETNKQNALEVEESIKEYNVWNKAIEIVKQVGVSDDVCEWKVFDNSLTDEPHWVYETTCGKYVGEEHTSNTFVYCPYCSKKIKVVE